MEPIDFSCKHDILIRNPDGTLSHMDEPYFESKEIAPGTWQILSDGDFSYLVEGADEALAIDSGYGCGNIREYCQSLTEKPVRRIANTHDHFDHTANDCYFDCAYMSEETHKYATIPFPSFAGIDFPRDYPVEIIDEGYIFHLGDRDLETFSIPDHAVGSLAFLDRKEGLLFSGDEIMFPEICLNGSVSHFLGNINKLIAHKNEFTILCGGPGLIDPIWLDRYQANANHILEGYEGKPAVPRPYPPVEPGPVIYDRRGGHYPDLPKANRFEGDTNLPNLRTMEYADCMITYDVRKIWD